MRVVATYDIQTDTPDGRRRLSRIAKRMQGFGVRIQKSVFECDIDAAQFERLRMAAEDLIDANKDSVIFFRLGGCCSGKTLRLGLAAPPFQPDQFVI